MGITVGKYLVYALALCCVALPFTTEAYASFHFDGGAAYRISCKQSDGSVVTGAAHGRTTPLFYLQNNTSAPDAFWRIVEVGEGIYALRNAATKRYITYNGVRSGADRRYIDMTDTMRGDSSLWTIRQYGGYYVINSMLAVDNNSLNLRSSMVVGTYTEAHTDNGLFLFYDENGNRYMPPDVTPSFNFGTTADGFYWENTGLRMPVIVTADVDDPVLYMIKNVRSGKYVRADDADNCLTQDKGGGTQFYFVRGTDGLNVYSKEGRYVSGKIVASGTKSVTMLAGPTPLNDNTWGIDCYHDPRYAGYGIFVKTCSANKADNRYVWENKIYWNDLNQSDICFYNEDGGSTYIFYSKDERHRQYLDGQGILLPKNGTDGGVLPFKNIADSLLIDGKTTTYDGLYGVYMKTIPESCRKKSGYTAKIHYTLSPAGGGCTLYIDGREVPDGGSHTFVSPGGNNNNLLQLRRNGKVIAEGKLTFTFLPIVELWGTSLSTSHHPGAIRVNDAGTADVVDSTYKASLRYRGATAANMSKKAYAVKLKNANNGSIDRKLLGMRKDNNWILDAMAIDPGRMRNRVATDLWLDYSKKPYQSEYEKKVVNGTRGKFVEVLLNGKYAGLYCMTEKIDRKQLKLKKIGKAADQTQSDTVRGTLYKSSSWSYSIFMGHNPDENYYPNSRAASYNNLSATWDGWKMKYPDLEDGEAVDWKPLYDAVNVVAANYNTQFKAKVSDYFDLPVFLDYYLFIELIFATDNHGKNIFLYNYDKTHFKKLSLCPWDLDGTFGRRWNGTTTYTSNAAADFISFLWSYEHGENTLFKRLKDLDYKGWNRSLADRWAEMRNSCVTPEKLLQRFADYRDLFRESGAEAREIKRWQGVGATMDFDYEMNYLKNWLSTRISTLDEEYGFDASGIHSSGNHYVGATGGKGCIYIHVTEPVFVNIYNLKGGKLVGRTFSENISRIDDVPPGVYIVNNKKVIVR